ncbi:hypothetical protein BDV40DRAFT_279768 [Aspergillus tamarii]|uniref:Uncharacterized protein n=1 Tax=Aspergillus tamarii TaxID=41984 RepID=A0A5N6UEG7_ASPTM|nr:hypothetical protein BDV40DRAFT_279768 [Aspergillus tamarii]
MCFILRDYHVAGYNFVLALLLLVRMLALWGWAESPKSKLEGEQNKRVRVMPERESLKTIQLAVLFLFLSCHI